LSAISSTTLREGGGEPTPPDGYAFLRYMDASGNYQTLQYKDANGNYQPLAYKVA